MIRASIVTLVIVMTAAPAAADFPLECKDVLRGDQNACGQKVKTSCTSSDYWNRRRCEEDIVVATDSCRNGAFETACKAALASQQVCSYYFASDMTLEQMFGETFASSYNRVDAAAADYAQFDKQWSACYELRGSQCSASQAEQCRKAPAYYRTTFTHEIDEVLDKQQLRNMVISDATVLIAANARLRAELRYRDADLKGKLARNEQAERDDAKAATARADAEEAAIRAIYQKAGIKGKRLELFTTEGRMPSDGRFMATGCGRFVTTVKEMKAAKKLFIWLDGNGEVTLWKYTFSGDNYVKDEKTFDRKGDAYRFCK